MKLAPTYTRTAPAVVRRSPRRERDKRTTVAYSALLGVAVIAVLQLLPLAELDWPLTISTLSFAISVPALTATVYIINMSHRADYEYEVETRGTASMDVAGIVFSIVGVAGLFWHLWWAVGVLFILSLVAVFAVFMHYLWRFGEVNAAEVAQDVEEAAGPGGRE